MNAVPVSTDYPAPANEKDMETTSGDGVACFVQPAEAAEAEAAAEAAAGGAEENNEIDRVTRSQQLAEFIVQPVQSADQASAEDGCGGLRCQRNAGQ